MSTLIGVLGIAIVLGIAFLMSNKKKSINVKAIGIMLAFQLVTTLVMFKTAVGLKVVEAVAGMFAKLIMFGNAGIQFVTGGLVPEGGSVFFINVLMLIIFTSTILSILTYIKVLPLAIKYVGGFLSKITGLPKVETFNAVNSIFFGQSESVLAIKGHLPKLNKNRLFIVSTSAMGSVSASIVGAYMTMIEPKYVLVAMILNMFSALIVASIVAPVEKGHEEEIDIKDVSSDNSIFEAISNGALDGGKVALIVSAMLVAFIGLIEMLNFGFTSLVGMDLQTILGYVFYPIAVVMGVPTVDALSVGSLMGTKIVANEFVSMLQFMEIGSTMTAKSQAIISTFLVSFANFSSIGIIAGSVQAVNGAKAKEVSRFGLKLLLVATLGSIITSTIVGLFV